MTVSVDPERHRAVIFDLDGVITDTASVHAAAWQQLFDEYLARRPARPDEDHRPFEQTDYLDHVDGISRYDGVEAFLRSRGIALPWGAADDPPDRETVCGLGNRKNRYFLEHLARDGVRVFDDGVGLARRARAGGLATAVISASRNCEQVLDAAELEGLFPVRVDGAVAADLGLAGKPDPAVLLEAARRLGVQPDAAVVVEDAEAGVEAGVRGGFGLVVGLARDGRGERLLNRGADVVVRGLDDVRVARRVGRADELTDALSAWDRLAARLAGHRVVVVLDFDGTLAPIVARPADAELPVATRRTLQRLAARVPVAVVSGRDLDDLRRRVGLDRLWYAGSHGLALAGPGGERHEVPGAREGLPLLDSAERDVREALREVKGAEVERKHFSLAVHYRNVDPDRVDDVLAAARAAADGHDLRRTEGRRVVDLRPDLDWDKGAAVSLVLDRLGRSSGPAARSDDVVVFFAGDDVTDEDALRDLGPADVGVVVRHAERARAETFADLAVDSTEELHELLDRIADVLDERGTGS